MCAGRPISSRASAMYIPYPYYCCAAGTHKRASGAVKSCRSAHPRDVARRNDAIRHLSNARVGLIVQCAGSPQHQWLSPPAETMASDSSTAIQPAGRGRREQNKKFPFLFLGGGSFRDYYRGTSRYVIKRSAKRFQNCVCVHERNSMGPGINQHNKPATGIC